MKEPNRVRKNDIKAISALQLNEEQKEAKRLIVENQIVIVTGRAGSGKANWIYTPILTPNGINIMGNIHKGDYVLSEKGQPIKVLDVYPQGIKPIYKITFSDGEYTHCTDDHLWNVCSRFNMHNKTLRNGNENKNHQSYQTLTLREIIDNGLKIGKKDKYFIPLTEPIQYEKSNLEIDPYVVGCLLGDGCFIGTSCITSNDDEIIQYFKTYFSSLLLDVVPSTENNKTISHLISSGKGTKIKYNDEIFDNVENLQKYLKISKNTYYKRVKNGEIIIEEIENALNSFLIKYNLLNKNSFDKHVPKHYLFSSIQDRIDLLQGLLDTDGWVQESKFRTNKGKSSGVYFCTTSKQLKDDIKFLVNSLGGICYESQRLGKWKEKGSKHYKTTSINYRIKICFNNPFIENQLFRLKRKQDRVVLSKNIINRTISKVEHVFDDFAQCILVDSPTHLYLTDNCIVTHNSLVCAQSALDFLKKKQISCIYNTRAAIEVGKSLGFLPGSLNDKFDPYMEALLENLIKCCSDKSEVPKLVEEGKVKALPVQFIRGKTIDDILIVEEAQNLTKAEMLAILTRLGKTGKIVINGDNEQTDIKTSTGEINGLSYVIELSKKIEEIKWIKLKENHRADLVGKILDYEYGK
jgi:phosphate starvation-inducible protein PhoH